MSEGIIGIVIDCVCCSVLQCVAVCCSVLQCYRGTAPRDRGGARLRMLQWFTVFYSVLQCVSVCCSATRPCDRGSARLCVLQCVAGCCSVLHAMQCVAVLFSVLQWDTTLR